MRTTVLLFDGLVAATFAEGQVECPQPETLTELKERVVDAVPSSPSIPDLDYERARVACQIFRGRITAYDGPPPTVPGRIY